MKIAIRGANGQLGHVSTEEFPRPAPRPRYSVLTTMQDARILLPTWEQGLKEFAEERRKELTECER